MDCAAAPVVALFGQCGGAGAMCAGQLPTCQDQAVACCQPGNSCQRQVGVRRLTRNDAGSAAVAWQSLPLAACLSCMVVGGPPTHTLARLTVCPQHEWYWQCLPTMHCLVPSRALCYVDSYEHFQSACKARR
jgi:hypothetical protein